MGMMISAIILALAVGLFAWQGYSKGALEATRGLLSSLCGYMAAYSWTQALSQPLAHAFGVGAVLAMVISSLLLFFGAAIVTGLVLSQIRNVIVTLREGKDEHDPKLGVVVGIVVGSFLGLLFSWVAGISLDAISLSNPASPIAALDRSGDPVRQVAGKMVGTAVTYVVADKIGNDTIAPQLAGQLVADPVNVSKQMIAVSQSPEIRTLFTDPATQELMSRNRVDQLQLQPAFVQLMQNPAASQLLDSLGSGLNRNSRAERERKIAELLSSMWQKGERLKADPRFNAIMQKPETKQLLANPNPVAILNNPDVKVLAEIAFANTPATVPASAASSTAASANAQTNAQTNYNQDYGSVAKPQWQAATPAAPGAATIDDPAVIYRWTDENGQRHFGQKKPEGNYPVEVIKPE